MLELYEHWYNIVSRGGHTCTRAKATQQIIDAHRRKQIKDHTLATAATAGASADSAAELIPVTADSDEATKIQLACKISKMLKPECLQECQKNGLDCNGTRAELRKRLADFFNVDLNLATRDTAQKATGKHAATWTDKETDVRPTPFSDADFNFDSLSRHLPGFPDRMSAEKECWRFYFTQEMEDLDRK